MICGWHNRYPPILGFGPSCFPAMKDRSAWRTKVFDGDVIAKIDDGTLNSVHDVFDYIKEHYSVASVIDNVLGLTEYVIDGDCKVLVLVNSATPGHELRAKVEIWLNV